jgi:tyrosyl-tRNA synthetase
MKSEFLKISKERGFIHQCTDLEGLDELMSKGPITAYLGFDATAPSLHVGSLVGIMWLRWLQNTGHRPLVLLGGGTSKVGDPSFKDEARKLIDEEVIQLNIAGIKRVFNKYLDFTGTPQAELVNNNDWLSKFNYLDFLRTYGPHFSVNRMLSFDSVKLRLDREQSLSFLEFNYMILQGVDFVELNQSHGCILQLGGSDQWGNIINGVELGRRMHQKQLFGLTTPLITTADGKKMGKTTAGAVWLNEDMLSPFDYWQFWRNTHDGDVSRYLKLFTELSLDEIEKLAALQGSEINEAKIILANEATKLAHGASVLSSIHGAVQGVFAKCETASLEGLPKVPLNKSQLPLAADELLVISGLCQTKSESRRLILGGGARLDDQLIADFKLEINASSFNKQAQLKVSSGKKKHICLVLSD